MRLILFSEVAQFPGIFVKVTMLTVVLQFQYVFHNGIHGVVALHRLFGINRNVIRLQLLMELLCLAKISYYADQMTVSRYQTYINQSRLKFSVLIFQWIMIMQVEKILLYCNYLLTHDLHINMNLVAGLVYYQLSTHRPGD
jgi:hypothetical protein